MRDKIATNNHRPFVKSGKSFRFILVLPVLILFCSFSSSSYSSSSSSASSFVVFIIIVTYLFSFFSFFLMMVRLGQFIFFVFCFIIILPFSLSQAAALCIFTHFVLFSVFFSRSTLSNYYYY